MDSPGKLLVKFYDEGDGSGRLYVQASSGGFAGEGSAWFSVEELEEFAGGLAALPINEKHPPMISGGFGNLDMSGKLDQEHLALSIYPIDRTGHLAVQVRISTEVWEHTRPESQHMVKLEILTSYQPLGEFSKHLRAVLDGVAEEAVLQGDL